MNRAAAAWFALAGVTALFRVGLQYFEPGYYDATSILDHLAVVTLSGAFVATGIALILLAADPPVRRGRILVAVGGAGAIAEGLGNLLEDSFGQAWAVWPFFVGGIVMMVCLLIAGIAQLTVDSPLRWSGLFLLLGFPGAMLGPGGALMGATWLAFAWWIVQRSEVPVRQEVGV